MFGLNGTGGYPKSGAWPLTIDFSISFLFSLSTKFNRFHSELPIFKFFSTRLCLSSFKGFYNKGEGSYLRRGLRRIFG